MANFKKFIGSLAKEAGEWAVAFGEAAIEMEEVNMNCRAVGIQKPDFTDRLYMKRFMNGECSAGTLYLMTSGHGASYLRISILETELKRKQGS